MRRSSSLGASLLLALCLCAAVASAATAPALVAPASKCNPATPGITAGGWSRSAAPPKAVFTAIQKELQAKGTKLCAAPVIKLAGACTQVVAGRNYQVVARVTCAATQLDIRVQAIVFAPLRNAAMKVSSLVVTPVTSGTGRRLQSADGGAALTRLPPRLRKAASQNRCAPAEMGRLLSKRLE